MEKITAYAGTQNKINSVVKPKFVVPRTKLMKLIHDFAEKRIIYINAPAGYSKTVSALLWIEAAELATGAKRSWIGLDEYDNQTADFCWLFAAALLNLQADNTTLGEIVSHPSFNTAPIEFTIRAINALLINAHKYNIVFDDLHLISNLEILKLLPILIKRLPQNFTVLVLSRTNPPESFSELIIKNQLAMVTAEHLRFEPNEIKRLFENCGRNLTAKEAEDVYEMTDGWAIGINALMLSGNKPSSKKLIEEYLEIYIETQVWNKWDEQLREFMIQTSVVEELTLSICNALTGRKLDANIFERLLRENVFLIMTEKNTYRFHHLFRDFLFHMLAKKGEEFVNNLYRKAADWFFEQSEYYRAIYYYMQCKYYDGVVKSLRCTSVYNSKNSNLPDRLAIIESLSIEKMPIEVIEKNPYLLVVFAAVAFSAGKSDLMANYIDKFKEILPTVAKNHPEALETFAFVQGLDYRESLIHFTKRLLAMPSVKTGEKKARSAHITQNLPFFHRSQRDYSEYVFDTEINLNILRNTFGVLIGQEYDVIEDCIRAGLNYEQGKIGAAYNFALSANAKIQVDFAAEIKFCAMMISTNILISQRKTSEVQKSIKTIKSMIEQDNAYYLSANLNAFLYRIKISDGDINAAKEWLQSYSIDAYAHLPFYKIFQSFTTTRAYINTGEYDTAIILLLKLLKLSEVYKRPLDIIESHILLSIAYWKIKKEINAFDSLERAVVLGNKYGYTQLFTNEGAELTNMLHKLHRRTTRKDYKDNISGSFAKMLYFRVLEQAKYTKGLTGGRSPFPIKLSKQQKSVMQLMGEGHSYMEIAEKLGLKYSTVRSHIESTYRKLDVSNSVDAIIKIKELKLLDL